MKYKACFSERIGTCLLVFTGTAATVINDSNGGAIPHPGVALVFGMAIAALIYAFCDISGASMNPARPLGSARPSSQFTVLWLHLTAPVIGAWLATLCCRCLREKECRR